MDDFTADALVNRDEPVPIIAVEAVSGNDAQSSDTKGKRERVKEVLGGTSSKLKDKLHEAGSGSKDYGYSLQDRLFTK
jgi:hypothetical protein